MQTKNIFKVLALAMLMPAMLLTTACSNDDEAIINNETTNKKGYPLQVTVNVSREGDDATRAEYNTSSKKLSFTTGDKLFVSGVAGGYDNEFAGTLDYVPATGKFSGTIYTSKEWTGTADALFKAAIGNNSYIIATLLPAGYEEYGYLYIQTQDEYNDEAALNKTYTLATSKAAAVEQFSCELAVSYSSGFALAPDNAILNFTITGLAASTSVNVSLTSVAYNINITGTVPTDASGNAKFAAGIMYDYNKLQLFSLTVGGNPITLVSSDKEVAKGKIYNIARNAIPGALIGVFSVGANKKVYFSKGNLQATYDGDAWTWAFAEHQYDYIGNAEGNTKVTNTTPFVSGYSGTSTTVDLFGWVGASSNFTGVAQYGITSSTTLNSEDGYGNGIDEILKSDWGATIGSGWRTLTNDEWRYLFNNRSDAANKYGFATVNGVHGIIFLPDAFVDPNKNDGSKAFVGSTIDWDANLYTAENWALMEKNGAVFLPAAGYRGGADVEVAGDRGYYWSSSAYGDENADYAHYVYFSSDDLSSDLIVEDYTDRYNGHSVRLVRPVQ